MSQDTTGRGIAVCANGLRAGYGKQEIVHGVSLAVSTGEVVGLFGPNGAGKSTTLKAIYGLAERFGGEVKINGVAVPPRRPRAVLDAGANFVPQGARIFPSLTVWEHIQLSFALCPAFEDFSECIDYVVSLIPEVSEWMKRPAGLLSAGQRQLVSIARALATRPGVLLIDEPSLGLSPKAAARIWDLLKLLAGERSVAVLLVEQHVQSAIRIVDRLAILRRGEIVATGTPTEFTTDRLGEIFLG